MHVRNGSRKRSCLGIPGMYNIRQKKKIWQKKLSAGQQRVSQSADLIIIYIIICLYVCNFVVRIHE